MYLMSVLTSLLWAFFLFFHTVISPYFLNCSAHLPHFYLVLLNFLPLLSISCSVRFYSKQFFLMWGFCPESEIRYTNFDSLLGRDCFSTTGTYCCLFALTLELDSIAHTSSFSCCSHLSHCIYCWESLRVLSSKALRIPIAFPLLLLRLFLIPQGSCSWYHSDGGSSTPLHLLDFLRMLLPLVLL